MDQDVIIQYVENTFAGVEVLRPADGPGAGDTFFFTAAQRDIDPTRRQPFATIVTKDYQNFDESSQLDRPNVFRLNIGVSRDTFQALLKDLLAGQIAFRAARIRHRDLAEGLDARQQLTVRFLASRRFHVGDKLRKRYDQSDGYREGEHDDNDQLFVRLDESGPAVAHYEILRAPPEGGIANRAL